MAYAEAHTISVTTDSSGDATSYSADVVTGKIINIIYTKPTSSGLDTADFTITTEDTEQSLWEESSVNASKTIAPRQPTHDYQANASLYAAAGEPVEDYIYAVKERIKVVIANGGDTKSGSFKVIVG